jgi:hypothetical protein
MYSGKIGNAPAPGKIRAGRPEKGRGLAHGVLSAGSENRPAGFLPRRPRRGAARERFENSIATLMR